MKLVLFPLVLLATFAILDGGDLPAQMFGRPPNSGTGTSLPAPSIGSAQGSASAAGLNTVGTLQGNERFIRGNRRGSNFVGGDSRDRRHFVGSKQEESPAHVRPATDGLRVVPTPSVNRPAASAASRRSGMYDPVLEIAFDGGTREPDRVTVELVRHLRASPALNPANRIEVSLEGTTATLRGAVVSERDRALAEQLILFEPGISAVQNDLQVMPPTRDEWRPSPTTPGPRSGGLPSPSPSDTVPSRAAGK